MIDSDMAKNLSFETRWSAPSGIPFDADKFLQEHPQWGYLKGYPDLFPTCSWNAFHVGDKEIS